MMVRKQIVLLVCLWTTVTAGYFFYRTSSVLVWCDSPRVAKNLFDDPRPLFWSDSDKFYSIFHYSFYDIAADGYRPLSRVIANAGTLYFSDPKSNPNIWFAAVGALIGSLSVVCFLVSRRFLNSDATTIFAVLLFLFSAPIVSGAWNVFCGGVQAIVPLFVCLGLLLYWQANEASLHKGWYWAGLYVVLFLGPWFREFIGLLPVLLVILEIQRAKRPTTFMAIAGLFFLHSLYPAAMVKLAFFPNLPVKPILAMGFLGNQTASLRGESVALIARIWSSTRWDVPLHFLSLFPPTLLLLALISLLLPVFQLKSFFIVFRAENGVNLQPAVRRNPATKEFLLSVFFLMGVISVGRLNWPYGILSWLSCGLAFLALRRDVFLAWWFLLFFIPFLWVFTEQVHLAYPMLPASIIVGVAVEDLWKSIQNVNNFFKPVRWAFFIVLILATGDQLLNPYGSYLVVQSANNGILKMASWFRLHVPPGSIVIANALHAEDIRLFSYGHIMPIWTVRAGIPRDSDSVADPDELAELLKRVRGKKEVYFLDVDFKYAVEKAGYHAHKYVRNEGVATQKIGLIHTTQALYPYVDPLKALITRPYISFLGSPDLENDFYRGPAQDGTPFFREVYAEYHVYKVTGTEVTPWDPNSTWKLVEESYKLFNIFENRNRYVAFAQSLGPVNLTQINSRLVNDLKARRGIVIGNTVDQVKRLIDQLSKKAIPKLVLEGFQGFNIIDYGGQFYIIDRTLGAVDLTQLDIHKPDTFWTVCTESRRCAIVDSLEASRQWVDRAGLKGKSKGPKPIS